MSSNGNVATFHQTSTTSACHNDAVDSIRRNNLSIAMQTSPADKALQALAAMETGISLKRSALLVKYPDANPAVIEEMLNAWLQSDER
jgi:hypothetical protein